MSKHLKISMLPSLLTLGNLVCGFLAIAYIADYTAGAEISRLYWAAALFYIAMVFDALDGKVARMTNSAGDFGGQLDSLADIVTFGLAPSFLVKVLMEAGHFQPKLAWGLSALFVSCAALRLAKFNVENTDHSEAGHQSFSGLPTPAAAGAIAGVAILYLSLGQPGWLLLLLPVITVSLAALMISPVPYAHGSRLMRRNLSFAELAQIVFVLFALVQFPAYAVAGIFLLYAVSGPIGLLKLKTAPAARRLFRVG